MDCRAGGKEDAAPISPFLAEMKRDFSGKGTSWLGKDGVFRVLSKDYKVIGARGLTPDEIKEFLALLPAELLDQSYVKGLEGVDGSKITSHEELYNPAPGILPEKPSEEEAKRRRETVLRHRQQWLAGEGTEGQRQEAMERVRQEAMERQAQERLRRQRKEDHIDE